MTNNIDRLEMLLEVEKQKIKRDHKKQLFEAAERNDLKTIKLIVEAKKYLPLKTWDEKEQRTVAHIAALNGTVDIAKYVADKEPYILSNRDRHGDTIFHVPDEKLVMEIIMYLEEKYKGDIPKWARSDFESLAIHGAAQQGHRQVLTYFLEKKNADVNALNDRQQSPIFTALENHQLETFKYLVEDRKANLTIVDGNKDNILFAAVTGNDLPSMRYVLDEKKADIDINWQNKWKHTLVHRTSILEDRLHILQYLVEEKHADVNLPGHELRTALDYASARNDYELAKYLVEHGAKTAVKDKYGYYPYQKAFGKKVSEYMKNVSYPHIPYQNYTCPNVSFPSWKGRERSRRNVDFQPVRLLGDNEFNSDESQLTDYPQPLHLIQLLQVLGVLRYSPPRPSAPAVSILHERMDSVAVDAVDTLPDLWDE